MSDMIVSALPDIQGVGLVLYREDGRIFIVFEGREKLAFDKQIGDPSIPWETRERDEEGQFESFEVALKRVCDEEIGLEVRISEVSLLLQFVTSFGVSQTIFCAKYDDAIRLGGTAIETGELLGFDWMFPEELANRRVRGGMREILEAFDRLVVTPQREKICE